MRIEPIKPVTKETQNKIKDTSFIQWISILFAFVGIFSFALKLIFF